MDWEVEATDEFFAWAEALERSDSEARAMLDAVIDMLAEKGPLLRRPYVGEIVTSRHHNMKELLVPAGKQGAAGVVLLRPPPHGDLAIRRR